MKERKNERMISRRKEGRKDINPSFTVLPSFLHSASFLYSHPFLPFFIVLPSVLPSYLYKGKRRGLACALANPSASLYTRWKEGRKDGRMEGRTEGRKEGIDGGRKEGCQERSRVTSLSFRTNHQHLIHRRAGVEWNSSTVKKGEGR
jgi:hypothetical protein